MDEETLEETRYNTDLAEMVVDNLEPLYLDKIEFLWRSLGVKPINPAAVETWFKRHARAIHKEVRGLKWSRIDFAEIARDWDGEALSDLWPSTFSRAILLAHTRHVRAELKAGKSESELSDCFPDSLNYPDNGYHRDCYMLRRCIELNVNIDRLTVPRLLVRQP